MAKDVGRGCIEDLGGGSMKIGRRTWRCGLPRKVTGVMQRAVDT
jgi:hypothetical protein